MDEFGKCKGSKYTATQVGKTWEKIRYDLEDKLRVLVVGQQCHISGLKKYLVKEYENLYTIDFICGGTPSNVYLKKQVEKIKCKKENISNIKFRKKREYLWQVLVY